MAVNLCSSDFGTAVTTNSVCADGYEVENLLGMKTLWGQPKGFMAESFIKPPVDVTFMLPFNVCIQKIIIHPKVGSQMSSGFEVFTASVAMSYGGRQSEKTPSQRGQSEKTPSQRGQSEKTPSQRGQSEKTPSQRGQSDGGGEEPKLRTRSQMLSEKESAVFASIGKAFSADRSTLLFCFVNHGYRPMHPLMPSSPHPQETTSEVITRSLRYAQPGALTNVSHVTVRVNSAPCGSIAIKYVHIFGQPSWFCSKPTVNWFLQVANRIQNPQRREKICEKVVKTTEKSKVTDNNCSSNSPGKKTNNPKSSSHLLDCPEEFIDPITIDMLMLPVLLPSGHTVDSETLRKHREAEALWGRPPNDPFTGIPFSKGSKPLPNVKLKERLDLYLLRGGRNVVAPAARDVGRSLSRATNQDVPTPASLVCQQSDPATVNTNEERAAASSKANSLKVSMVNRPTNQPDSLQTARSGSGSKRKLSMVSRGLNFPSKRRPCILAMQKGGDVPVDGTTRPSGHHAAASSSSSAHEQMLSQSLDSALEDALSSLPSFNQQPVQKCNKPTDDTNSWSCQSCHRQLASKDGYHVNWPLNMYTLPCAHLMCRGCLLPGNGRASRKCTVCDRTFETAEVVKVHV